MGNIDRFIAGVSAAVIAPAALAAGMQITTTWRDEPAKDPQGQLATSPIFAAARTQDNVYELHLICGKDQYDGNTPSARLSGTVLELAISTFDDNDQPAPIKTRAASPDSPATAEVNLKIGAMSAVKQAFRADSHANVISAAYTANAPLSDNPDSDAPYAGAQLAKTAKNNGQIVASGLFGLFGTDTATLPLSINNPAVRRFMNTCPITKPYM